MSDNPNHIWLPWAKNLLKPHAFDTPPNHADVLPEIRAWVEESNIDFKGVVIVRARRRRRPHHRTGLVLVFGNPSAALAFKMRWL
jgi:hypothetical protein